MSRLTIAGALLCAAAGGAWAESITVPNASFESPTTTFVSINIDNWQKTAKPDWYVEDDTFLWTQLTGLFKNTPVGSFDHLDNCDSNNAIWLFAVPEVGLFQDFDSVDWNDASPTHAFNATYQAGKSYSLIVGVNGGGGNMPEGATMDMSLYYRDGSGVARTIATTTIVNSLDAFPDHTHLTDYQVQMPVVKPGDAWEGKHIGIRFLSTVPLDDEEAQGGYWDLDNIRLVAVPAPVVQYATVGGNLRVSWISQAGYQYQAKVSEDLITWTNFGSPQPGTGGELFTLYPQAGHTRAFFRLAVTPSS